METATWAEDHPSGAREIDRANECLEFLLEEMFLKNPPCEGDSVSCRKIEDTQRFLARQFAREENMMARTRYPATAAHRTEHAVLLERLETMRRDLVCGAYDTGKVYEHLTAWAADHVTRFDRDLGQFLASHRDAQVALDHKIATDH